MSSTTEVQTDAQTVTLDGEALKNYQAFMAAEALKAKKAEEAKQARIRANNRPTDKDGEEKPASLAYAHRSAELLARWAITYQHDPTKFMERVVSEFQPNVEEMGNTDRKLAGVTYDSKRRDLERMFPPDNAVAPKPSK